MTPGYDSMWDDLRGRLDEPERIISPWSYELQEYNDALHAAGDVESPSYLIHPIDFAPPIPEEEVHWLDEPFRSLPPLPPPHSAEEEAAHMWMEDPIRLVDVPRVPDLTPVPPPADVPRELPPEIPPALPLEAATRFSMLNRKNFVKIAALGTVLGVGYGILNSYIIERGQANLPQVTKSKVPKPKVQEESEESEEEPEPPKEDVQTEIQSAQTHSAPPIEDVQAAEIQSAQAQEKSNQNFWVTPINLNFPKTKKPQKPKRRKKW